MSDFLIGLAVGMIIIAPFIVILSISNIVFDEYPLEKILSAQKDCLIKEYYYLDQHRVLCDKIGVTP
jgi:hypothetical protein